MQHFFILRWSKRKRYERYERYQRYQRYQRNSSRPATHHKNSNSERLRLLACKNLFKYRKVRNKSRGLYFFFCDF